MDTGISPVSILKTVNGRTKLPVGRREAAEPDVRKRHAGVPVPWRQPSGAGVHGAVVLLRIQSAGDVVGLVDKTGTTMVTYKYDVWGKPESTTGPMATTLEVANPFRYRGYYYDTESGFYYLQSRYYDPEVGRFLNADAYLNSGHMLGTNAYVYCYNNPVMYADYTGWFGVAVCSCGCCGRCGWALTL